MFSDIECIENADLSRFSTIKIGGIARFLVYPKDAEEFVKVFNFAKNRQLRIFVLGNGSNTLFNVDFFDGVVISTSRLNKIERVGDCRVKVDAGVNIFLLNQKLKDMELGGFEFSYGIPASFGGLVYMNGGAFGSEVWDFLETVTVFDGEKISVINSSEHTFSYRNSGLEGLTILSGVLKLSYKPSEQIAQTMEVIFSKRKAAQPYDKPSLGSVFKRILGKEIIYPAKLIDTLALKGVKIGGVEVSTKHAGFIVNNGNGTANDYIELMRLIERKVYDTYGVKLEKEVQFLSEKE